MRMYKFNAPQERVGPRFFTSEQDYTNVNVGRFVRNAVLSGMTYGGNDLVPSFLKTCDAIHPLCGTEDFDGVAQSCYGALLDSVNNATTKAAIKSVVQPWNTSVVWAPGGRGLDSWLAAKLPEATLIERYIIASTNTTCPLSWKLQGSNDGSAWADLDVVTNTEMWSLATVREEKVFTIPEISRGTYLWYRIYITGSNATTMSISTFRLLRPASVCDRGQLRLDASAGNPLMLSFMDGFAADGVTPVDYDESLSAAIVQALGDYDSEGLPISGAGAVPVDIFAKRDASGSVVVSVEAASTEDAEYLAGGMTGFTDRGFVCNASDLASHNDIGYRIWGDASAYSTNGIPVTVAGTSLLSRADQISFYVSHVVVSQSSTATLRAILPNGTVSVIASNTGCQNTRFNVQLFVSALRTSNKNTVSVFGRKNVPYKYRIMGGKVYQLRSNIQDNWSPVQKIKIASGVYNGTDLYQLEPRSSMLMQWMTKGDNVTYLDA